MCVHLATPFSGPSGYQKPTPAQSGHFCFSSAVCAGTTTPPGSDRLDAISAARALSTFQRRRRRCSARKAGTFETVVRAAAIRNSEMSTSASSSHFSPLEETLPVSSLSASINLLRKARA